MSDRWGALFHALTGDTVDTVDTVAARTAPAAQSVKTVQSVHCRSWRKEDGAELQTHRAGQRFEPSSAPFAEALAALERACPDYVEANRWWQAIEDGRRFLARWGDQAVALGWTAEDLFGLHTPTGAAASVLPPIKSLRRDRPDLAAAGPGGGGAH